MGERLNACPRAAEHCRSQASPVFNLSAPQTLPPFLLAPPSTSTSSSLRQTSHPARPSDARGYFLHRSQAYATNDNAPRTYTTGYDDDFEFSCPRLPQLTNPAAASSGFPITLPSPQALSLTTQLHPLPLPPPFTQAAVDLRRLSSAQSTASCPSSGSHSVGVSPVGGRTALPSSRRSTNSNSEAILSRPPTSQSCKSRQANIHTTAAADDQRLEDMRTKPATVREAVHTGSSKPTPDTKPTLSPSNSLTPAGTVPMTTTAVATPPKSRRVRTGCLTCRERHLKCDEGVPDCLNCKKGNRECKRGLRLNFIDIQLKPIPYIPAVSDWCVSFLDESRLIASEYAGGLARYPRVRDSAVPLQDAATAVYTSQYQPRPSHASKPKPRDRPPSISFYQEGLMTTANTRPNVSNLPPSLPSSFFIQETTQQHTQASLTTILERDVIEPYGHYEIKGEPNDDQCDSPSSIASSMVPQGLGPSSVASFQAEVGNSPTSVDLESGHHQDGGGNPGHPDNNLPEGLPTPLSEKMRLHRGGIKAEADFGVVGGFDDIPSSTGSRSGEREYLNKPDEVLYMQVFVEEVGVWMDSLDKDKHFSRIVPYLALKSQMILSAIFACGAKHLAIMNETHRDGDAQFYYAAGTMQLVRSLQNPDRDTGESATAAVILNVYDLMNESLHSDHVPGARALIRECRWNAKSKGVGAACFWLNIGMEVLSCLENNWPTTWEPDAWGLDTEFTNAVDDNATTTGKDRGLKSRLDPTRITDSDSISAITGGGDEEMWVQRIYYIVAKIANFRAGIPRCQEPSPHDEQARIQDRFSEWKRLKSLCDTWNRNCPRSMRPFSYLFPFQSELPRSMFPNIWLIKRPAVIGRLFYHTAMVLLHQTNPVDPIDSTDNLSAQRHHAHQVCGIVAHTKHRGVANVAIRSLAVSALVLTDSCEQDEVYGLLKKISEETGWRIDKVYDDLQHVWGRDIKEEAAASTSIAPSHSGIPRPPSDIQPGEQFSSHFGIAGSPLPGTGLPMPLSYHRGSISFTSQSPLASRPPLPEPNSGTCLSRTHHHLRMQSTASIASNASLAGATTAGSSPHVSPLSMAIAHRPPLVNPLLHADFSLSGHPYKAFYRPPNDSPQSSSQPL